MKLLGIDEPVFNSYFEQLKSEIINRGSAEIDFYKSEVERIKRMSRKEAVEELIKKMKLQERITTIEKFVKSLEKDVRNDRN